MGLRLFDANLIIAVAQDAARRGEMARLPALAPAFAPSGARDEIVRLALVALGVGAILLSIWIRVVTG